MNLYRIFLDSIFPRRCPVCGEIVNRFDFSLTDRKSPEELICPECRKEISFVKEPVCSKCGKQVALPSVKLCHDCANRERLFGKGTALLNYNELSERMTADIKYNNKREYIRPLAGLLALRAEGFFRDRGTDALIPVPVHESRRRVRGYNQAQLIAEEVSVLSGIPVRNDLLVRTRRTAAMKELDPGQRYENLRNAFAVNPEHTKMPRHPVLVDDIYTTGATVNACAKVLKEAGADEVDFISLCIGSEI